MKPSTQSHAAFSPDLKKMGKAAPGEHGIIGRKHVFNIVEHLDERRIASKRFDFLPLNRAQRGIGALSDLTPHKEAE